MTIRFCVIAASLVLTYTSALAQSPEPKKAPNEADVILQDSEKSKIPKPLKSLPSA